MIYEFKPMSAFLLVAASQLAFAQTPQNTTYSYKIDAMDNVTQITDPLGRITINQYDRLNRLQTQTLPPPKTGDSNPVIRYAYDGLDQLVNVVADPRYVVTNYTINGLGNQTSIDSTDTGTTSKTYDDAGNVKTQTDAKSQTTSYTYDVLNRIKTITYADASSVTYDYDQGQYGLGHLAKITDASGIIAYGYDQKGRVTSETRTINGVAYITGYQYNPGGSLMTIIYPSGRTLNYLRDAMGRIAQIDTTKDGVTKTLVSQLIYHPFGGVKSFTNGAGQTVTYNIDLDGRNSSYTLGAQTYSVGYDAASRIKFITDVANPVNTQNFDYDDLDRLSSYSGTGISQSLNYDATGNRTSKLVGTTSTSYAIKPGSNRIDSLSGSQNITYNTDANGSITNNGANQFGYDARGRMISATTTLGNVQYRINPLGQRIAKTVQGITTVYHYDLSGKLIAESNDQGQVRKEYVYLDDRLVAFLR